jgi:hypothetical protein
MKYISEKLPRQIINNLRKSQDTVYLNDGDIPTIIIDSLRVDFTAYSEFLNDGKDEDPDLISAFGPSINPYISAAGQQQVFNILATYQPLLGIDFGPGANMIAFVIANYGLNFDSYQYHHSKMAISLVMEEIQTVQRFTANCPGITSMMSGQIICDLRIVYANVILVIRLHKV